MIKTKFKQPSDQKINQNTNPITSEQEFNGDKRPFVMIHAYLFAATQRGLMEIRTEKKDNTEIDYSKLKQEVDKERKKNGNVSSITCQFTKNKDMIEQYNMKDTDEQEEEEEDYYEEDEY
jgi:hypothetical protein